MVDRGTSAVSPRESLRGSGLTLKKKPRLRLRHRFLGDAKKEDRFTIKYDGWHPDGSADTEGLGDVENILAELVCTVIHAVTENSSDPSTASPIQLKQPDIPRASQERDVKATDDDGTVVATTGVKRRRSSGPDVHYNSEAGGGHPLRRPFRQDGRYSLGYPPAIDAPDACPKLVSTSYPPEPLPVSHLHRAGIRHPFDHGNTLLSPKMESRWIKGVPTMTSLLQLGKCATSKVRDPCGTSQLLEIKQVAKVPATLGPIGKPEPEGKTPLPPLGNLLLLAEATHLHQHEIKDDSVAPDVPRRKGGGQVQGLPTCPSRDVAFAMQLDMAAQMEQEIARAKGLPKLRLEELPKLVRFSSSRKFLRDPTSVPPTHEMPTSKGIWLCHVCRHYLCSENLYPNYKSYIESQLEELRLRNPPTRDLSKGVGLKQRICDGCTHTGF
jgi:hypothetical protein